MNLSAIKKYHASPKGQIARQRADEKYRASYYGKKKKKQRNRIYHYKTEGSPQVYYMGDGNGRIKIGYTRNLPVRIRQACSCNPSIKVLATEPGTRETERLRHRQFKQDHIIREWFTNSDLIQDWIGLLNTDFVLGQ